MSSEVRVSNDSAPRTSLLAWTWSLPLRSTMSRNAAPPWPRRAVMRPAMRYARSVSSPASRCVVGGVDLRDGRDARELVREGIDALLAQARQLGAAIIGARSRGGLVHAAGGY